MARGRAGKTVRSPVELRGNVCVRTPAHVGRANGVGCVHIWTNTLANGFFPDNEMDRPP